jgi:hypothetical protein
MVVVYRSYAPQTLNELTTTTINSINIYNIAPVSLDNFIGIIHEVGLRRLDIRIERS